MRTQTRRVARYDRSEDHGHTLPTVLLARLASSQFGNEVRAVFPGLLQRVEDGTGVGIVIDAEPDERAAEGREEGLEEDERDGVVGVVCRHCG